MIPSSVMAAGILLLAVLPGAAYTWALERQVGSFGVALADRSLRFFGSSVVFHAVLAWPEYGLYRLFLEGQPDVRAGAFAALWGAIVMLLVIPFAVGSLLGGLYRTRSTRDQWSWVRHQIAPDREQALLRFALGHDPAPRAWDHLFSTRESTYLRVLTAGGNWIGGGFADASYAGGFPRAPAKSRFRRSGARSGRSAAPSARLGQVGSSAQTAPRGRSNTRWALLPKPDEPTNLQVIASSGDFAEACVTNIGGSPMR
ncbi:MAG: DUF6338 family protein [Nocardioidaceae bacterium]